MPRAWLLLLEVATGCREILGIEEAVLVGDGSIAPTVGGTVSPAASVF